MNRRNFLTLTLTAIFGFFGKRGDRLPPITSPPPNPLPEQMQLPKGYVMNLGTLHGRGPMVTVAKMRKAFQNAYVMTQDDLQKELLRLANERRT